MDIEPSAIVFIILVVLFFVFRFLALWYWRVNEIVGNQKQQIELLEKQIDQNLDIIALLEMLQGIDPNAEPTNSLSDCQPGC